MSNCKVVTFPVVFWVRCGAWLCWFLIFALSLTLLTNNNANNSYQLYFRATWQLRIVNVGCLQKCRWTVFTRVGELPGRWTVLINYGRCVSTFYAGMTLRVQCTVRKLTLNPTSFLGVFWPYNGLGVSDASCGWASPRLYGSWAFHRLVTWYTTHNTQRCGLYGWNPKRSGWPLNFPVMWLETDLEVNHCYSGTN